MVKWINGTATCKNTRHLENLESTLTDLYRLWATGRYAPRTPSATWFRHVYREGNTEADKLAKLALSLDKTKTWEYPHLMRRAHRMRGFFDGAKTETRCGYGFFIQIQGPPDWKWQNVHIESAPLPSDTTTIGAELSGATNMTATMRKLARC